MSDAEASGREGRREAVGSKSAAAKEEVRELENELADAGINIRSFRNIIDKPENFRLGIPILVRHMQMTKYSPLNRNFMAQAIAMRESNPYWPTLVKVFRRLDNDGADGIFKQGVAVALAHSYGPSELGELIALCNDKEHGTVRILLAAGLKRSKKAEAVKALRDLIDDPDIGKQVSEWVRRREARQNRS
jgi:hypothetical protein